MEVRFPHFIHSGKMLLTADCSKSQMYIVIPTATIKNYIKRHTQKHY